MKKLLILLCLTIALLAVFSGCGGETPEETTLPEEITPPPANNTATFTITWVDENGNALTTQTLTEGETPAYTYNVTDTAEWDYTFEGWASAADGEVLHTLPAVTQNATYYAKVSAVKKTYTVTFRSNGGSSVSSQTVEYGQKATMPTAPTYSGHRFVGWSYDELGTQTVDFNKGITENVEYFAIWNKVIDVKALLSALLEGYDMNPIAYIPESMRVDFSDNLVDADDIVTDYSEFVNISNVAYGFGEQWHLVLENLEQSKIFFQALSAVEGISAASITAFNNYFDQNPADTAHHSFQNGIYNVTIDFDGEVISYVLDYTATFPVLGTQTAQIALSMDIETSERNVRVQLGDANAVHYTVGEGSYDFAIKYLGTRRAMLSIEEQDDGTIYGKIYEYLTVSAAEIASAAEFYITDEYVSVVGNKANGMVGFTGYINELYNAENGKLLGYEVQETLSAIVYNTLWFNLDMIGGINNIKYQPQKGDVPASVFVNGSNTKWATKNVGGLGLKMLSRRFDIEFRTQYVYSYDPTTQKYTEHQIQVPMIFVQEECYEDFASDVKAANKITVSVKVNGADVEKILEDYDALIPEFIKNKNDITTDAIIAFIGNKVTF